MKNSKLLLGEIVSAINLNQDAQETYAIAYLLLEKFFGLSKTNVLAQRMVPWDDEALEQLQDAIKRINRHEPVQYVTGEQHFYGRAFGVSSSVLIPRPETEELVRTVLAYKNRLSPRRSGDPFTILDIGTGSGCIPITLFHEAGPAEVYATDVSSEALSVAARNAQRLDAAIHFINHNILEENIPLTGLDVVVSNPPYVTEREKPALQRNVIDFEPHLALFVPDEDPLLFYREIARQAKTVLKPSGLLAVEINEKFGREVSALFAAEGFGDIAVIKDIAGKERVVRAVSTAAC